MLHLDCKFDIKDVTDTGSFCGYGSVYGIVDQGDDIVAHGAFTDSLADHTNKGTMPAMLWQHRSGEPIGAYQAMKEDTTGLYVEGKLAMKVQRGLEAHELMKMKALTGLSIGFLTRQDSYDQKTGIRTITKGDLWEVSPVTFPMNDSARISAVKSIEEITDFKSANTYLRNAGGFSRTEATALIVRLKALSLRNAVEEEEANSIIAALSTCSNILKGEST
jgi:HK97 family phage prohead protease